MTLDTDRSWGVTYVFTCCLVIKIISVVTTYIFKDSLLETKMSYFHTSFCGCLKVFFFFFLPNLTFMEALKFCQNMSALPISEWNGPMRWYWWLTQFYRTFLRSSPPVIESSTVSEMSTSYIPNLVFFYNFCKSIIKQEFSPRRIKQQRKQLPRYLKEVIPWEVHYLCDICIDFTVTDGTAIHESR